ncbi:hypothetical protein [Bacillus massiliigorillae]|uniref:DUF5983 family protein n=1 Tax=Bacillus massiliigorillae TaxID=1243664 RepID=UPI0003A5D26F|nr:hypothetical protein [Bacillus massiliigorillae]
MIENMLTLSRVHISKETEQWLNKQVSLSNEGKMDVSVFGKGEGGWFIPVNARVFTEEVKASKSIPVEFFDVYNYAITHKCTWIMIDHEAAVTEELPTYS